MLSGNDTFADAPVSLYARVSTDEQASAGTIENQTSFFRRWCELHGYAPGEMYLDAGVSGIVPLKDRPEGARLLADARAGRVHNVAIYRIDRIGRGLSVILDAIERIETSGGNNNPVPVRSMTEAFDTVSPSGKLVLGMLGAIAQYDRDSILMRTREGQARKARAGGWLGGHRAAYGYRVEGRKKDAVLAVDDQPVPEAASLLGRAATRSRLAAWIFEEVGSRRNTCFGVADTLNALGVPSYLGGKWNPAVVSRMVKNPVYKGMHRYGDERTPAAQIPRIERPAPALVSETVWDKANRALATNRDLSTRATDRRYLLRGLMVCAHCGGSYVGRTQPGMHERADETNNETGVNYYCLRQGAKQGGCRGMSVPGVAERLVWEHLAEHLSKPDLILWGIKTAIESGALSASRGAGVDDTRSGPHDKEDSAAALDIQIEAKQNERATILKLRRREKITDEEAEEQLDEIREEEALLVSERNRQNATMAQRQEMSERAITAGRVALALSERFVSADGETPVFTFEQKREWLTTLISRIEVTTPEGTPLRRGKSLRWAPDLKIQYRFPIVPPPQRDDPDFIDKDSMTWGNAYVAVWEMIRHTVSH